MDPVSLIAACAIGLQASVLTPGGPSTRCSRNFHPTTLAADGLSPGADPWAAYVAEASRRFAVPENWIRAVMQAESRGLAILDGVPLASRAGAIGLMQLMPDTYAEMKSRHGLGNDPYDPRDNVLAGTAFMREMIDRYGAPGFLGAYNAGPTRFDDALAARRPLPDETRRFLADVAPRIGFAAPPIGGLSLIARAGELFVGTQPAARATPETSSWRQLSAPLGQRRDGPMRSQAAAPVTGPQTRGHLGQPR